MITEIDKPITATCPRCNTETPVPFVPPAGTFAMGYQDFQCPYCGQHFRVQVPGKIIEGSLL
jgi:transcription elongation factor Elf1